MKTTSNNPATVNTNAANAASTNNKINDFGHKIGGARKDLYQAAHEWAAQLANITAESLNEAGGVSKLVKLPNLEKMAEAGAITADQARAALVIWRGIERKPQGSYKADRWAENTRARLEAVAAVLTGREAQTEAEPAEMITAAKSDPEFIVLTAANWPAVGFSFGKYGVIRSFYSGSKTLHISTGSRRYYCQGYTEPADVVAKLREMVTADEEKAAERRARGPRLSVYNTSDRTQYFIAVDGKTEIVLRVCATLQEAREAVANDRAALLARYDELRNFPALRRSWNRPRIGKEWHTADVTPEQFAAAIPFKGVEFGNWLNQNERAALLNSAFDGFHDLADLLGIPAEAVALGGRLNFSFATRGLSGSAAHFDAHYNTINLNKRNGAGCMAHEWLHACDHYAAILAGRGAACSWGSAFATENTRESYHPADVAARDLIRVIKTMDYYTRSQNYQIISGKTQGGTDYYTQPCELAARGFEAVCLYLLQASGMCSDFLVNLETWKTFETNDAGHRRDCYPYPSDAEAAALLPYYMKFFRALFGRCEVSKTAAEGIAAATAQAEAEKAEADRIKEERAAKERAESMARREAQRQEWARKAAERKEEEERKARELEQRAEITRAAIVGTMTARHFDTITTGTDSDAVYFVAHLEGEIYAGKVEITTDTDEAQQRAEAAPLACIQYKRVHNLKSIKVHRYGVPQLRSNKQTARELLEVLTADQVRQVVNNFADFIKAENIAKAAKLWADTQRLHEEQDRAHKEAAERKTESKPTDSKTENREPVSGKETAAHGLQLVDIPGGVAVVGTADTEQARGRQTYKARHEIKAHGAKWNRTASRWEATDPATVAALRQWLETDTETTAADTQAEPQTAPALETPADITEPAEVLPALPEWLTVGAVVRTHGRYMINGASMRREWVGGEKMTVKAINADFVELEKRDEAGHLRGLSSCATAAAADYLEPVSYSAPEKSEPAAVAASYETAAEPEPAKTEDTRATYQTSATEAEKVAAAPLSYMETATILDNISVRIFAPWHEVGRRWIIPFRGARDVWNAFGEAFGFRDCGRLEEWALTAKTGDRAELCGLLLVIWERDGITAQEPTEEADRLRANREARERLRAAIVAELEAAGVYMYNFCNDMKVLGKVANAAELCKVEDIARRYKSAKFIHDENDTVYEFVLPLFFPYYFPSDPEPEPTGTEAKEETLVIKITKEETAQVADLYEFAGEALRVLWEINPESKNSSENNAYVWNREDIDAAADALRIDRAQFFEWCHNNADFITSRVMVRAAIALNANSPAPSEAHRLFEWSIVEERAAAVVCASYETGAPVIGVGEITTPTADPLADIIRTAKQQESRTVSGLNYGPIDYIKNNVLYRKGHNQADNFSDYENSIKAVTDPATYAAYLLSSYDIFVDETQVYCDIRRAFPSLTFTEICKHINDHIGRQQVGSGIAAALVPDYMLLQSEDDYTREKFRERHENYCARRQATTNRLDLKKWYDRESLAVHRLLCEELYYYWTNERAARCLEEIAETYPDMSAHELHNIYMKYADAVTAIYG